MSEATLAVRLVQGMTRGGGKTAIIRGERRLSHDTLLTAGNALDRHLRRLGVVPGDRVGLRLSDPADFVMAAAALLRGRAIAVPIDRPTPEEQAFLIADADPHVIIHDDSLSAPADVLAGRRPIPLAELDLAQEAPEPEPPRPDDPALLLYTSGTMGRRKGVVCSQANLAATTDYILAFSGLDDEAVEYVGAMVDHAFGFGRCRSVLAAGGTLVLDDRPFTPLRALALLRRQNCNAMASVSAGYVMLLRHFPDAFAERGKHLRWLEIGSMPLPADLMAELCETCPHALVMMNYGMTEAQRSTLIDIGRESGKRGSVGRAAPGTAVRIVDEQTGACLPPYTPGAIEVSGPHVVPGYWRNEEAWRARFRDGWFRTDDVGQLDAEGYLWFIGRRDEMMNVGGEKLSPVDIEERLRPLLDRPYCVCAAGDPQGVYGDIPVLCIEEASAETDWPALRAAATRLLPPSWVPKAAVTLRALPRTATGKVQRKHLRRLIEDDDPAIRRL